MSDNHRVVKSRVETWAMNKPFRISGAVYDAIELVHCSITDGHWQGRGEAAGVDYRGETIQGILDQVQGMAADISRGMGRHALLDALPAGGARNAIDCALWDLECKQAGRSIFDQLTLSPAPVTTVYTIGIDTPSAMAREAANHRDHPVLKVKLGADQVLARMKAVHLAAPDSEILVDVNGGWSIDELVDHAPRLADLGVRMIEQPLPDGRDEALEHYDSPVLLCADESCQGEEDLPGLAGRYGMVNIKLDKTGGLTAALALVEAARRAGFELMVGNMLGTSLGMAPAFVIAQFCRYADIDGPLLQREDRSPPLRYERGTAHPPDPRLWG